MKVSVSQRVQEFKEESFIVSQNGALFCQSCREELSLKKQNIAVHESSKKDKANKEKMEKTTKKERHITDAIAKYDEAHHHKGETLPISSRVFRVKIVQAFLKSGTPLNRMKYFRDLFQESGFPLTSPTHMRQLIPFVLEEEYKSISKEILGKELSIIFDGTTRDGEP